MRPAVLARGRVDVGVPPQLAVAVDPPGRHVGGAFVQQIGAAEGEPVQVVGARGISGVVVQRLDVGDVLRQVEVPVHLNGDILEVQCGDGLEDVVLSTHFEADRAAFGTLDERVGDGVRVIGRVGRLDDAFRAVAVRRWWRPVGVGRGRAMPVSPLRRGGGHGGQRGEREEGSELDHADGASSSWMGRRRMRRDDDRGIGAYLTSPKFSAAPLDVAADRHNFSVRRSGSSGVTVLPVVDEIHPISASASTPKPYALAS